jgi:hypothetical protein
VSDERRDLAIRTPELSRHVKWSDDILDGGVRLVGKE